MVPQLTEDDFDRRTETMFRNYDVFKIFVLVTTCIFFLNGNTHKQRETILLEVKSSNKINQLSKIINYGYFNNNITSSKFGNI